MAGPLLPYVTLPELSLGFLHHVPLLGGLVDPARPPSIKPFGTLVALGVYLGSVVAMRHARERKLDLKKMNEFIFWVVGLGFVGGHVLDAIFYHPARVARDPLYLLMLWDGLSSYGGFIGAIVGAVAWRASRAQPILHFCECVNSAFPLAWVFGRSGCSVVHDHPGKVSSAWYAVKYPGMPEGVGRLDLGYLELAFTIPLAAAFLLAWRKQPERPLGFYSGWMCVAYAPVRFVMDFFREGEGGLVGGDPRYAGLTPAQWASFGLLALGLYFLRLSKDEPAQARMRAAIAAAETPAASARVADDDDEPRAAKPRLKGSAKKGPSKTATRATSGGERERERPKKKKAAAPEDDGA